MKVKIQADGTAGGTRVLDENDEPLRGISAVEFVHRGRNPPLARIELFLPVTSLVGEAKFYGPNGKAIKKVVFEDGTEVEY